jgi:hypothetical protein
MQPDQVDSQWGHLAASWDLSSWGLTHVPAAQPYPVHNRIDKTLNTQASREGSNTTNVRCDLIGSQQRIAKNSALLKVFSSALGATCRCR